MLYGCHAPRPEHKDWWEAHPMILTWKAVGKEGLHHMGPLGKGAIGSEGQMTKETQQSLGQLLHGSLWMLDENKDTLCPLGEGKKNKGSK